MAFSKPLSIAATVILSLSAGSGQIMHRHENADSLPKFSQNRVEGITSVAAVKCLKKNVRCDWDKDGLLTRDEKRKFKTNPYKKDTNRNGIPDGDEDSNKNGVANEDEDDWRCKDKDRDHDGIADEDENDFRTRLTRSDTDGDGILDGDDDSNENGIADGDEQNSWRGHCVGNGGTVPTPTTTTMGGGVTTTTSSGNTTTTRPAATTTTMVTTTRPPTTTTTTPRTTTTTVPAASCKSSVGIPAGVTPNKTRGQSLWQSNSCSNCHGVFTGSSYSKVRNSYTKSGMSPYQSLLTNTQNAADIAGYLNNCP